MPTKLSDIYCLNETIKNDIRLSKVPKYLFNSMSFKYLKIGIGFAQTIISAEYNDFIKQVGVAIEPTEKDYEFIGNGVDNEFLLNPAPPLNSEIYVGFEVDGEYVEQKNFTFDSVLNVVTTANIPLLNQKVIVIAFTDGEFVGDLDYSLQTIMAEAMNIGYLEEKQNDSRKLDMLVHSNAWRVFSQNDQLRGVNYVLINQRRYVENLLKDYSYSHTGNAMTGLIGKKV